MRIIHGQGYSDKDRAEFAGLVYRNIMLAVQVLADAMAKLKINYQNDQNRVSERYYEIMTRPVQQVATSHETYSNSNHFV